MTAHAFMNTPTHLPGIARVLLIALLAATAALSQSDAEAAAPAGASADAPADDIAATGDIEVEALVGEYGFMVGHIGWIELFADGRYSCFVNNGAVDGCLTVVGSGVSTGRWHLDDGVVRFRPEREPLNLVRTLNGAWAVPTDEGLEMNLAGQRLALVKQQPPPDEPAGRTPEDVVMAFYGPGGIDDRDDWYVGEMLQHHRATPTLGEGLPPDMQIDVRRLDVSEHAARLALVLSKDGMAQDWYAFVRRTDGPWKLEAVRTLALSGLPAMALEQLEAKDVRTPEEEWDAANLRLMFTSDLELKAWAVRHREPLDAAVALAVLDQVEQAEAAVRDLFISSIHRSADGHVELIIGGMLDNTVGLAFAPEGGQPPVMHPSRYIYVEAVGDGWYLFKTT